ncbi:MAG: hypothetical protein JNL74_00785, partial [Fibrobacteres bacterium]|nr:hypothetical protein [Fibrobacterota bacterium]
LLADSLCKGASAKDNVKRIHEWLTKNIRYSYEPFRQSAYVPQLAHDVLSTKIGDCKDMASLGQYLFGKAGVKSWLTLVNTQVKADGSRALIGPDFNHCILAWDDENQLKFIDFTSPYMSINSLPSGNQGAIALVVGKIDTLIKLPYDRVENASYYRAIDASIDSVGFLSSTNKTIRTGRYAAAFRSRYRDVSPDRQKVLMLKSLTADYSGIVLDTFITGELNQLTDSVTYVYKYHTPSAVAINGNIATLQIKMPDEISPNEFPLEEKRTRPLDLEGTYLTDTRYDMIYKLTFNRKWKPVTVPKNVTISSPYGKYSLSFTTKANEITCVRAAEFYFKDV